jgi:hypothetical protein
LVRTPVIPAPALNALPYSSPAQGGIADGSKFSEGQVFFASGHLAEFIFMESDVEVDSSLVTIVARAAASRIDAAGLGS